MDASTPPENQQPPEFQYGSPQPDCPDQYQEYIVTPARSDVAVIVTAHNSAAFLDECMESILAQSLKPARVVIVDDCSDRDNTAAVARSYERHGCTVRWTSENFGMCRARTHGLEGVHEPVVMFFDGDDVMPPGYLATMRRELGNHGFVYPGRSFFGVLRPGQPPHINAPSACRTKLWSQNFCPSPSMMWRHVFDQVGGWQQANPEGTLPDWDLFLRMSGVASFSPSSASCLVRRHDSNYSSQRWSRPLSAIYGDTRMHAATITVGMIYSGRVPGVLDHWLKAVTGSLRAAGKRSELLVLDDSENGIKLHLDEILKLPEFTGITVKEVGNHHYHHRRTNPPLVSQFLASAYNQMLREATGDILWMIEDDILVPRNACTDLMRQILASDGSPMPGACGCYRSRHNPQRFVLSSVGQYGIEHHASPPAAPMPIQLTGTGCLMVLRDLIHGMAFRPQWSMGETVSNAHDWTLSSDLFQQGRSIMAVPSVVCPHYHAPGEFV